MRSQLDLKSDFEREICSRLNWYCCRLLPPFLISFVDNQSLNNRKGLSRLNIFSNSTKFSPPQPGFLPEMGEFDVLPENSCFVHETQHRWKCKISRREDGNTCTLFEWKNIPKRHILVPLDPAYPNVVSYVSVTYTTKDLRSYIKYARDRVKGRQHLKMCLIL